MTSCLRLASFDIGRVNFAQYIEDIDIFIVTDIEKEYSSLPSNIQRKTSGPVSEEIKTIIQKCCNSGKRVHTGVYDFTEGEGGKLTTEHRKRLLEHLKAFVYLWDTCDIFMIEQQFFATRGVGKGAGVNTDAIKLAEGTFMWFLEHYPTKNIQYFGSQYKTQRDGR